MGLRIRSKDRGGLSKLITLSIAVLALAIQPLYGLVASKVAEAAPSTFYTNTKFSDLDWSIDRKAPTAGYTAGPNTLTMGVHGPFQDANSSKHFEGIRADLPGNTSSVRADLYVDPAWDGHDVMVGMWGVLPDTTGADTAWPTLEFTNMNDGTATVDVFDTFGGGAIRGITSVTYGQTITLEIEVNRLTGKLNYYLGDTPIFSQSTTQGGLTYDDLTGIIFNNYNSGFSHTVVWSNLRLGETELADPVIKTPTPRKWFNTTPIKTEWTNVEGATEYQVAYAYDDGHSFSGTTCPGVNIDGKTVYCRNTTSTTRNHMPAQNEQGGVTIWVRAINSSAGMASSWSNSVHYFYDSVAPTTDISVSKVVDGKFTVSGTMKDNLALNRVYVQLENGSTRCGGTTINLIGQGVKTNGVIEAAWSKEYTVGDIFKTGTTELCAGSQFRAHAAATDMAGNTGTAGWTSWLNTTEPTFTITYPNETTHMFRPGDKNIVRVNVKDQDFSKVEFTVDGTTHVVDRAACDLRQAGNYVLCDMTESATWTPLAGGEYTASIRVYSTNGNQVTKTTRSFTIDAGKPQISDFNVPEYASKTLTVSAKAEDNIGVDSVEFWLASLPSDGVCKNNLAPLGTKKQGTLESGVYTTNFDLTSLGGKYCVLAQAGDAVKNHSPVLVKAVIVDNVDPELNIADGSIKTESNVSVIVTEENISRITVDGQDVTYATNGSLHTFTVTGEGMHTIIATDKAGNTTTVKFTIDTIAPAVEIIDYDDDLDGTPALYGVVDDPEAQVTVTINGVEYTAQTYTVDVDGETITIWFVTFSNPLPVGTYTVVAKAKDVAGNETPEAEWAQYEFTLVTDPIDEEIIINRPETDPTEVPEPTDRPDRSTVVEAINNRDDNANNNEGREEGDVLGAQTQKEQNPASSLAAVPTSQGWKIGGLLWYWWLIILAAIGVFWWIVAAIRRRRNEENA